MFSRYGLVGILSLAVHLVFSKLLFPSCRLVRLPIFIRGRSWIDLGTGFTAGRACRLDAWIHHYVAHHGCKPSPSSKHKLIRFGKNVEIGDYVHIAAVDSVQVGDNCLIASRVYLTDHDHGDTSFSSLSIKPSCRPIVSIPVSIGEDCWIGQNVCILKGVSLGKACVVAAGAVVTKSFPPYSIIAGVPARLISNPIGPS